MEIIDSKSLGAKGTLEKNISDWFSHHMVEVNHACVVMPYGDIDMGQYWTR